MSRSVHMDYEAFREHEARLKAALTNAIVWAHDAIHSQRQADYVLAPAAPEQELADDYERNDHQ